MGVQLLERSSKSVALTNAGQACSRRLSGYCSRLTKWPR